MLRLQPIHHVVDCLGFVRLLFGLSLGPCESAAVEFGSDARAGCLNSKLVLCELCDICAGLHLIGDDDPLFVYGDKEV